MRQIPVLLARVSSYNDPSLTETIARLLEGSGFRPAPGTRVLVKPNLVAARTAHLSTTHLV